MFHSWGLIGVHSAQQGSRQNGFLRPRGSEILRFRDEALLLERKTAKHNTMDNIYLPAIREIYESYKLSFTSRRCNLKLIKFFSSKAEFKARERQQKDAHDPVWLCYSIKAGRSRFKLRADLHSYF